MSPSWGGHRHTGGHLEPCGDVGVHTDLLPGGFVCIPCLLSWVHFFFLLSRFLFVPFQSLISDGNGRSEVMALSECSAVRRRVPSARSALVPVTGVFSH